MAASAVPAVLLLTFASASAGPALSVRDAPVVRSVAAERLEVRLFNLATVRRLFQAIYRQRAAMTEGERVAAWTDFSLVTEAVLGEPTASPLTFDNLAGTQTSAQAPRVLATRGVANRDAVAYRLLSVGYSARETADVVSRRISLHALDTARRMITVGMGREAAANYLDSEYTLAIALPKAQPAPSRARAGAPSPFDALIEQYATVHNVEAAIVRAIIQTESAFNPAARSPAGAIGLMQLMPTTARELGVNPFVPEQNIEGGVRYFSQLLKMFGGIELALVAYNAGPGFAQRYARGESALYGETREYVKRVLGLLNVR